MSAQENLQPPAEQRPEYHVTEAHRLLTGLREKLDKHPELERAIEELELALNKLTLNTGGML